MVGKRVGSAYVDGRTTYFGFIGARKLMSPREERAASESELVEANLRLVVGVAKRFRGHGMDLDDLIQIGNIALMAAARNFNPSRGRFSTYALRAIEQALSRATAEQGGFGHIPETLGKLGRQVRRLWSQMAQELGREPTLEEVAERLGVPLKRLEVCERASQSPFSLERLVFEADGVGESPTLGDVVPDKSPLVGDIVTEHAFAEAFAEAFWRVIKGILPELELMVLELRFGRQDGITHTLIEVGKIMGVSYEWVRQLQNRALRRLRESPEMARFKVP